MKRVAAAAFALLLILLPTPAHADVPFHISPCVETSLTDVTYDAESMAMVLNGVASQCAPVVENGGFRIATYLPRSPMGGSQGWQARRFEGPVEGEVRPFAVRLLGASRATYGVCLISGGSAEPLEGKRVACGLVVQPNPQTSPPTASLMPLSSDDPLVDKWVIVNGGPAGPDSDPDGVCGTCF
jgi:hypothetical protein